MESNFKKAFREVFNGTDTAAEQQDREEELIANEVSQNIRKVSSRPTTPMPNLKKEWNGAEGDDRTVITRGTHVEGKITTTSDLLIEGILKGDIVSNNSVVIRGAVEGNIAGRNCEVQNAVITGNITAESAIVIAGESQVTGDLRGDSLSLSGKITGNIINAGDVVIDHAGCVVGDISAAGIAIERGAIIRGAVLIETPPVNKATVKAAKADASAAAEKESHKAEK